MSTRNICSTPAISSREVSEFECSIIDSVNQSTNVSVLNLVSKTPLEFEHVKEALDIVTRRQPLLTSSLGLTGEDNKLIFKENAKTINLVKTEESAVDWLSVWEGEHFEEFDLGNRPLWRAKILQEFYNSEKSKYQNSLVFSFHPVIADSQSIATLMGNFLQSLEAVSGGKASKEHKEQREFVLSFLGCMTQTMLSELLEFTLFYDLRRRFFMKRELKYPKPYKLPENIYCSKNPPVILREPDVQPMTSIYTMKLSREETASIAKACETKGDTMCVMEGAALAAAVYAASLMIWKEEDRKTLYIPFSMNVNVRPLCVPKVARNYFGNFGSSFELKVDVPPVKNDVIPEWFWLLANECSYKSSKHFKNCEFYRTIRADLCDAPLQGSMRKAINENPGSRTKHTFNFNFVDDIQTDKQGDHKYTLDGYYHGASGHYYGPAFSHNLVLMDGQLMWSLVYYKNISTREEAEHMAELALEILLDAVEHEEVEEE